MFIQEYINVLPSSLDDNTNTYNVREHTPYPSFSHVFNKTGVNMKLGIGENDAKGVLMYMTDFTMNTLMALIPPESRNMLEFLIAKSEQYRRGFIDTVCAVVSTTRAKGISDFLATGSLSQDNLPLIVQITAISKGLLVNYYIDVLPKDVVRRDY